MLHRLLLAPDAPHVPTAGETLSSVITTLKNQGQDLFNATTNESYGNPAYTRAQLKNYQTALFGEPGGKTTASYREATPGGWFDASGNLVSTDRAYGPAQPSAKDPNGLPANTGLTWRDPGTRLVTQTGTVNGTPGMLDIYERMSPRLSALQRDTTSAQRGADIADVMGLGPLSRTAQRVADPDSAAILDRLNGSVLGDLASDRALTPAEARDLTNRLSAGRLNTLGAFGPAAAYGDALGFSLYGDEMQTRRRNAAYQAMGANRSFYGDPFAAILGRGSNGVGNTMAAYGQGAGSASNQGTLNYGQLFNAQSAADQTQANLNYQADAAGSSMLSGLMGGLISAGGTLGGAAILAKGK